MMYKIIFIANISLVLYTIINVFKDQFNRRQRKYKEIIILDRSIDSLFHGLPSLAIFFIFLTFFIIRTRETYYILKEGYIDNIFQLLNVDYLDYLRRYFSDKAMLWQLYTIVRYKKDLITLITGGSCSFSDSLSHLYKGFQQNIIYESGILYNGLFIYWDQIVDYKWSNIYEKKYFIKGKYTDLILSLPKTIIFNLDKKVEIRVNYSDKELVNRVLEEKINKRT